MFDGNTILYSMADSIQESGFVNFTPRNPQMTDFYLPLMFLHFMFILIIINTKYHLKYYNALIPYHHNN